METCDPWLALNKRALFSGVVSLSLKNCVCACACVWSGDWWSNAGLIGVKISRQVFHV